MFGIALRCGPEPRDLLFLQWLLKGIEAFPEHPALTQLLLAYFQEGDLPDDQLAEVLVRLSHVAAQIALTF